jgi:hypothetical protein
VPTSKLKEWQVQQIKARLAAGESQASIGRDYGIAQTTVSQINTGRIWKCTM